MSTLRTFNLQHPESSNNNIQLAEGGGVSVTAGILTATNVSSTNVTTTQVTATNGTFSGNLSVGGVLSYEDVTNVDSTGIGTFRSGIDVTGGNVKIGTTTAGQSEADDLTIATSAHTGMTIRSGTTSKGAVYFSDGTSGDSEYRGVLEYNHSVDHFRILTAASERLRIDLSGRARINTAGDPAADLHVGGTSGVLNAYFQTSSSTGAYHKYSLGDNSADLGYIGSARQISSSGQSTGFALRSQSDLEFCTGGSNERVRITSAGNVGINDTAPSEKLNVGGNIMLEGGDQYLYLTNVGTYNAGIYVRGNTASSYLRSHTTGSFHWEITGSEKMKMDSAGRLMLGTATEGEANADDFTIATSAHTGMTIRSGTTNRGNIYFSDGTSGNAEYRGYITYDHDGDKFSFGTANATRIKILGDGTIASGNLSSTPGTVAAGSIIQTAANAGFFVHGYDGKFGTSSNNPTYLQVNGTSRLTVTTSGNVEVHNGASSTTSRISAHGFTCRDNWGSASTLGNGMMSPGSNTLAFTTNSIEKLRITSDGKFGLNTTSPAGQVHIKGNTDESANPSIILDDNGDTRRCYVTNTSGDMMLGGIDGGTVQSRLTIHENGNMYHQRLNSSGSLQYQFQTSTSQTSGAASGNTYAEHMAFRPAYGMKQGSFTFTVYGDGGDNYMPVLFIRHGYHPTNSSFGGQWFGEMWINCTGSMNPQNYNHTGYNNWATMSFKYRWDCAHWNAKPTLSMIEHYANYGRPNIADLEISGTQSYFVMWLLPMTYRVTYSAWDGLNAWYTNNNNVGGALTHREGGGNTTRAVRAYSGRDTRYDSNISWGTQGAT